MQKRFLAGLLILFFTGSVYANVRPEYPRPDMKRPQWLNINGDWNFTFDPGNSGENLGLIEGKNYTHTIIVPFAPESKLSGIEDKDFHPVVWYNKPFEIPSGWEGKRILLHFEAVDYKTTVWLNQKKVGTHQGGYTPFTFDITSVLNKGANLIIVKAEDDVRSGLQPAGKQSPRYDSLGCFYTRTTGIWQTVWLEPVSDTYIERFKIYPDIDTQKVTFEIFLNQSPEKPSTLHYVIKGVQSKSKPIPASKHFLFEVPLKNPRLWNINDPYLYEVTLSLVSDKTVIDEVETYFGMRKIHTLGNKIYLNNKPIFLRTVLDQGFYPDGVYTAPSDEDLKKDIELSMAFGFNGARLHQRVFERRFLYWADKLGYLVWGEFADWGLNFSRIENYNVLSSQWQEAIERDFNHPSIIGWCPLNELWGDTFPEKVKDIFTLTKTLDPTRLVIDSSGGIHYTNPDVYDSHNYQQNPQQFSRDYDGLKLSPPKVYVQGGDNNVSYKGQPFFVSEYGGIWWNPDQKDDKGWGYGERPKDVNDYLNRYKELTTYLLNNPFIAGFCYTQLYDIEQEVNGLCTYNRKPKYDPQYFYNINTQQAAIEK